MEKSLKGANLWNEVKDRLNKPGSGLSGGQQQRLCIARAIAVEPQVLLMDEPCSALDPISTLAIEDLIGELKERFTIVIVTHNMQQAARVSRPHRRSSTCPPSGQPGKLIEIDDTERIFSNPSDAGDRGLHLRPLRLISATDSCGAAWRCHRKAKGPLRPGAGLTRVRCVGRASRKARSHDPVEPTAATSAGGRHGDEPAEDDVPGHAPADRRAPAWSRPRP